MSTYCADFRRYGTHPVCQDIRFVSNLNCMSHPLCIKRWLNSFAKSIDSCQSAQSTLADICQNFLPSLNIAACQFRTIYIMIHLGFFYEMT